ncbi:MAG: AbrB family transcriptional regulator [Clostridiales bacterium GWE2_32_10]|nr:MAG: AbrB family transcriptional regulator [Clostridiales bacterium GWE2_32_10]HBY19557.1 AbrB family transcriptional regulator [Clostridiales bacterium]
MKSTGIVRKVDELGRIVLPIELRRNLGIQVKDSLEIFVNDEGVILQKYQPACVHTGTMDNLIDYNGKKVSRNAIKEMAIRAGFEIKEDMETNKTNF